MADTIRIKRRAAGGAAGAPASLAAAEIAYNEQDDVLYYGKGNSGGNAVTIIPIGGPGAFAPVGGGGGAPVGAEYVTSTADATLTAERVLTDTATVTWDRTTAGQIKANAAGGGAAIAANISLEVNMTVQQSGLTTGQYNTVKYNNKITDTQGTYNTTTGLYTPNVAGVYAVSASAIIWAGVSAFTGIGIAKNGVLTTAESQTNKLLSGNSAQYVSVSTTALIYCNGTTDTISAQVWSSDPSIYVTGSQAGATTNMVAVPLQTGPQGAAGATGPKGDAGVPAPAGEFSTGDVKLTLKIVADTGWVLFNDGTIGSAASGATYANANANALFTLLFANTTDANCPIQTSAGGATTRAAQTNAATAWTNNCRMALPKVFGRALAGAGAGSGLSSRALGDTVGAETDTPTAAKLFQHKHNSGGPSNNFITTSATGGWQGAAGGFQESTMTNTGSSSPVPIMSPTIFLNVMVKL